MRTVLSAAALQERVNLTGRALLSFLSHRWQRSSLTAAVSPCTPTMTPKCCKPVQTCGKKCVARKKCSGPSRSMQTHLGPVWSSKHANGSCLPLAHGSPAGFPKLYFQGTGRGVSAVLLAVAEQSGASQSASAGIRATSVVLGRPGKGTTSEQRCRPHVQVDCFNVFAASDGVATLSLKWPGEDGRLLLQCARFWGHHRPCVPRLFGVPRLWFRRLPSAPDAQDADGQRDRRRQVHRLLHLRQHRRAARPSLRMLRAARPFLIQPSHAALSTGCEETLSIENFESELHDPRSSFTLPVCPRSLSPVDPPVIDRPFVPPAPPEPPLLLSPVLDAEGGGRGPGVGGRTRHDHDAAQPEAAALLGQRAGHWLAHGARDLCSAPRIPALPIRIAPVQLAHTSTRRAAAARHRIAPPPVSLILRWAQPVDSLSHTNTVACPPAVRSWRWTRASGRAPRSTRSNAPRPPSPPGTPHNSHSPHPAHL